MAEHDNRPAPEVRGSTRPRPGSGERFARGLAGASGGPRVAAWGVVVLLLVLTLALVFDF